MYILDGVWLLSCSILPSGKSSLQYFNLIRVCLPWDRLVILILNIVQQLISQCDSGSREFSAFVPSCFARLLSCFACLLSCFAYHIWYNQGFHFRYPPKWKLWVYQVGYNLGHNWLRLPISLYKIPILLMINSMLNHVALLKLSPRSPNSMLSLCHGKLPKVVAIELGEGETKFVWSMCINLAILARKVSRVMCPRLHAASTVCLELLGPDTPFFLWAFFFFWGLN
jgi:hypothetical protein